MKWRQYPDRWERRLSAAVRRETRCPGDGDASARCGKDCLPGGGQRFASQAGDLPDPAENLAFVGRQRMRWRPAMFRAEGTGMIERAAEIMILREWKVDAQHGGACHRSAE